MKKPALRMFTRLPLVSAAILGLLSAVPASAGDFLFDFAGSGFFGGTLNATGKITTSGIAFINPLNGYTAQNITGISGTFNGSAITGLAPGLFGANNLFYTSGPFFVDGNGLGFTTTSNVSANLFITNDTTYRVNTQGAGLLTGLVTASAQPLAAPVPEPATWAMMLVGFSGVGFAMRRRRDDTTAKGHGLANT